MGGFQTEKKRLSHIHSKVFRNFLSSYLWIILCMFSMVSIAAMKYIANNMRKEEIRIAESKLYTIVEDLEIQMEAMRRMTIDIASQQEFCLDFFSTDKYKEIELLDRLDNYRQVSEICDDYFIKYEAKQTVYTSSGTTSFDFAYLIWLMKQEDCSELIELLNHLSVEADENVVLYKQEDKMLFIYPLKRYAFSQIGKEGVLCFVVNKQNLEQRVERLVGDLGGKVALYYKENCLLEQEGTNQDTFYEAVSKNGSFTIRYWIDEKEYFSWQNVLSVKECIVFAGIALVILLIGLAAAYRNYLPLQKIVNKYSKSIDTTLPSDWESLEILIESLLQGREKNSVLIKEQHRMLQEQTIRIIALGGYSETIQRFLSLLNIKLEGNVFGIIKCVSSDFEQVADYKREKGDIEALSGDGAMLYAYYDKTLCVLASVEEEYQLEELRELIQELFSIWGYSGSTELICSCHGLENLYASIIKAGNMAAKANDNKEDSYKEICENAVQQQNTTAWKAVEYIKAHCTDYDMSLEKVAEEFRVTSTYVCRIIKQQVNMSYKEYLTELRIAEAKRMLLETESSVVDICQQTGYSHVSYFIKLFQKYVGMTPAKYRDEEREKLEGN